MSTAAEILIPSSPTQQRRSAIAPWRLQGRTIAAAVLAGLIFWLDVSTCLVGAVAVLYALVLLVAGSGLRRRAIVGWSLGCAALTVASFLISPCDGDGAHGLLRLGVGLAANIVTTALLLQVGDACLRVQASERRYRTIFDSVAVAIWEHDFSPVEAVIADLRAGGVTDLRQYLADHPEAVIRMRQMVRITDVNETALSMMGVPRKEMFFSHLSGFLPESDESFADCIVAIGERREMFQAEVTVMPVSGEPIDVIVTIHLGGTAPLTQVPGCVLNISERRKLETAAAKTRGELERAQRAELLGAITASIAHEINQPLAAIQSFADAAKRWLARDTPDVARAGESLTGLSEAVTYAREVIKRTRSLVRHSTAEAAQIDLTALLSDAARLMRQEAIGHRARILVEPEGDRTQVMGDRILLQQVLVNLITNALQAMEAVPPAQRLVRLSVLTRDGEALIRVSDNGPGWKADLQDWLMDPFITTKPDGMGLGLSICRSVLEAHSGSVRLRKAPGGGAEVELVMPALVPTMA